MSNPSLQRLKTERLRRQRLGASKGFGMAAAVATLVIGGWIWIDCALLPGSRCRTLATASGAIAVPPDFQPEQEPGLPTSTSSRLAMPWLARGHPTPVASPSPAPPPLPPQLRLPSTAIEIVQGLAFIGSGTVLQTIDIRDPHAPRLLGRSAESGLPNTFVALDIVVTGTTVFMLCLDEDAVVDRGSDNSAVLVFDVANPAAPRLLQSLGLREIAFTLFTHDEWLYVGGWSRGSDATAQRGVRAIDARQRNALQRGPFVDTATYISDTAPLDDDQVVVVGATASDTSTAERASLQVLSLAQPGMPVLLGSWEATGSRLSRLSSVSVFRGRAYAASDDFVSDGHLYVLDVTKPSQVDMVVELQLAGHRACAAPFIAMTGTVAAVLGLCGLEGEALVTVAPIDGAFSGSPLTVGPLGSAPFRSSGQRKGFEKPMAASGERLYVLDRGTDSDTLRVVDVSAPASPSVIGRLR